MGACRIAEDNTWHIAFGSGILALAPLLSVISRPCTPCASGECSIFMFLPPVGRPVLSSLFLESAWPSPGCFRHLGCEPHAWVPSTTWETWKNSWFQIGKAPAIVATGVVNRWTEDLASLPVPFK